MSGRKSKVRGYRGEILLRDFLRARGWEASRVVLSGAHVDHPGDVKATKEGRTLLFEVKNHTAVFKKIYQLYAEHITIQKDDLLTFACKGEPFISISISTSLDTLFDGQLLCEFAEYHPLHKKYSRTFKKITNLFKLVGPSDVLVLKDNNLPFLFIRYR